MITKIILFSSPENDEPKLHLRRDAALVIQKKLLCSFIFFLAVLYVFSLCWVTLNKITISILLAGLVVQTI